MHELVPGRPVTNQDEVVESCGLVSSFTYVSIKIDELGSVHCNNHRPNPRRRLRVSLTPPEWTDSDFSASNAQ